MISLENKPDPPPPPPPPTRIWQICALPKRLRDTHAQWCCTVSPYPKACDWQSTQDVNYPQTRSKTAPRPVELASVWRTNGRSSWGNSKTGLRLKISWSPAAHWRNLEPNELSGTSDHLCQISERSSHWSKPRNVTSVKTQQTQRRTHLFLGGRSRDLKYLLSLWLIWAQNTTPNNMTKKFQRLETCQNLGWTSRQAVWLQPIQHIPDMM